MVVFEDLIGGLLSLRKSLYLRFGPKVETWRDTHGERTYKTGKTYQSWKNVGLRSIHNSVFADGIDEKFRL